MRLFIVSLALGLQILSGSGYTLNPATDDPQTTPSSRSQRTSKSLVWYVKAASVPLTIAGVFAAAYYLSILTESEPYLITLDNPYASGDSLSQSNALVPLSLGPAHQSPMESWVSLIKALPTSVYSRTFEKMKEDILFPGLQSQDMQPILNLRQEEVRQWSLPPFQIDNVPAYALAPYAPSLLTPRDYSEYDKSSFIKNWISGVRKSSSSLYARAFKTIKKEILFPELGLQDVELPLKLKHEDTKPQVFSVLQIDSVAVKTRQGQTLAQEIVPEIIDKALKILNKKIHKQQKAFSKNQQHSQGDQSWGLWHMIEKWIIQDQEPFSFIAPESFQGDDLS